MTLMSLEEGFHPFARHYYSQLIPVAEFQVFVQEGAPEQVANRFSERIGPSSFITTL